MLALTTSRVTPALPVPQPRVPIAIRQAVASDLPFIDRLQKMHTKAVGWMPTNQLEGCIKLGRVLIAEESPAMPVGYLLAADRYFKRDDVGIIYQMNVLPERQRGFVAASLLKAQFERSAYGCKLYCCWCAQDLAANKFWEAMGFVPLAFRTGGTASGKKPARMHIFWQKRIRSGDESTPWWFPSETSSGAIRENRIVLPIPPGTHWSECEPPVFAKTESEGGEPKAIEQSPKRRVVKKPAAPVVPQSTLGSTLRFGTVKPVVEKAKKEPKVKVKLDPGLKAAARELKDRWLEQVNGGMYLPQERGKYEVSRGIEGPQSTQERSGLLIEQMPIAA